MPPTYRPPQRLGKQPPAVLPSDLAQRVDLGDGATWPSCLMMATGSGLQCITLVVCHGHQAANLDQLEAAPAGGRMA